MLLGVAGTSRLCLRACLGQAADILGTSRVCQLHPSLRHVELLPRSFEFERTHVCAIVGPQKAKCRKLTRVLSGHYLIPIPPALQHFFGSPLGVEGKGTRPVDGRQITFATIWKMAGSRPDKYVWHNGTNRAHSPRRRFRGRCV